MVANTTRYPYLDTFSKSPACANDKKRMDEACKPDKPHDGKNKHPALKKLLGAKRLEALEKMASKVKDKNKFSAKDGNAWMSHCDGLWIKPDMGHYAEEINTFNDQLKGMSDDIAGAIESQLKPLVEKVGQEVKEAAMQAAKDKAIKAGVRSGARWGVGLAGGAVGGVGAVVTEVVATAWNIVDWVDTGIGAVKLGTEAYGAVKDMRSVLDIAGRAQSELGELAKNAAGMSPSDMMGNGMGAISRLNRCTRARRCQMVPFNQTDTASAMDGDGCCPGQTGHHVIPEEAVESCEGYSHGSAPTICVEGTNNSNGTHGQVHGDLAKRIEKYKAGGALEFFTGPRETIRYENLRDMGVNSVQKTFPESKCDEKCLRAQLDSYYKDKCKKPMKPAAGAPGGSDRGGKVRKGG